MTNAGQFLQYRAQTHSCMHIKAPHVTLTFTPDVVMTPLALHVMEDGWLAAPEGGVSVEIWSNSKSFMSQRLV